MEFGILGPLEVRADGRVVSLGGAKPRAVLAVLALHANRPVSAEQLAVALWGDDTPPRAVKTVQVYVARLRKALGDPDVLDTTPGGYCLRVRPGELDAERFERHVAEGREALAAGRSEDAAAVLRDALELWRGPPLAELASAPFAPAEIARLEEQHLAALEVRVEADLAAGRHAELVGELQQLTSEHPWRERLHAQLLLALYRSGRQADALEAYRRAREFLVEQLGVEPGEELNALHRAILAHDPEIDGARAAPGAPFDAAGALPVPPSVLFGREDDLAQTEALIGQMRTRLVTLVGPGGVGKTRLAIEAARRLAQDFRDGGRFVSLAAVAEPSDLASAIGRALAAPVREGEQPTTALRRFLGDRHLLLVLDNFEHLLAGAPLVGELLAACPGLTVLVTSREPTRLAAERVYPVRALEVPPIAAPISEAELAHYGAIAMFVDRAQARDPDFALDEANATHVREICRRLDGLPLALELAAARVGLLSPAELAARLDRALTVLGSGARDAPERHRTLRATIDWSLGLLTAPEREAFTRLAVFASGATVTAAESVTGAPLATLDSLLAKQLVVRRGDRLLMLETVRDYALELLDENADADTVRDRLAAWCVDMAREATPHLVRDDRVRWLARLDAELPNLLAVLSWALETGRGELALQLVGELGVYWWDTNQWEAGLPWIDAALEQAGGASTHAQARALLYRARLVGVRQSERYHQDLEASVELFSANDDAAGIATCLGHLAAADAWRGCNEEATALSDEAMKYAKRTDNEQAVAFVLTHRAIASTRYDDAAPHARTALHHLRRVGDLMSEAHVCSVTGYLAIIECRYQDALTWLAEGLEASRRLGYPKLVFFLRGNQGVAWLYLDELGQAAHAFGEALAVAREAGCEHLADETLLGLAAVSARRGELARAARLAGAAASAEMSAPGPGGEEAIWSRTSEMLTAPRESYGPERWDRAAREGASLTVQEAIDLGLMRGQFAPSAPGETAPITS